MEMSISTKRGLRLRLCVLTVLGLAVLLPGSGAATTPAGMVVAWGCGGGANFGQCNVPAAAESGVAAIAVGDYHSLALKQDGSVIAWGCGGGFDNGQCSVPVAATSGVTAIAAANAHSLALRADGSVVAWGCTQYDVAQCNVPAAATTGVTGIAAAYSHSLALKQDGSVVAWGCAGFADTGQCGSGGSDERRCRDRCRLRA
jgi:alpha-tubulin suppressor-like RCC1 family protein